MKLSWIAISLGAIALLGWASAQSESFLRQPLVIQSLESRTVDDGPVFNEIQWFEFPDKDVWMMNQSHHGLDAPAELKDRVVIIIDKTKSPKTAYFLQIEPGPLVWSDELYTKQIPYKVSCFMCHANGPRALRADWNSFESNGIDRLKEKRMNWKINSYGLVAADARLAQQDLSRQIPFRYGGGSALDNQTLKLKACISCHDGERRSVLTRQNAISIQFLVQNQLMPPEGHKLTVEELKRIDRFTKGL